MKVSGTQGRGGGSYRRYGPGIQGFGARPLGVLSVTTTVLLAILLVFGATAALAADDSNTPRTYYGTDNYSDGYNIFYPHNAWRGFDMVYYEEEIWQSFYRGGPTSNLDDEIGVYLTSTEATATPAEKPFHYKVPEPGQTWTNTDRRITADRLAVFRDRLFLYVAKSYDDNTGMILWQKDLTGQDPAEERWNPPGLNIWEDRHFDSSNPLVVRGLVVKAINDTLYILVQRANTKDVYLLTTQDAINFSAPKLIHTFAGSECILNGDVIAREVDGKPVLALVTKDDAFGNSTGTIKLWTFDPETEVTTEVATFPNKYKDMALVPGDVLGCTPYDRNAVQFWGIGWGTDNLYHMQYVFGEDAKSGTFDPTGILDAGNVSSHIEQSNRGYLAACLGATPVTDANGHQSLQQTARVWWWGSTTAENAFGKSAAYNADYLKSLGEEVTLTDKTEINDAWILQGVITGLPPYYPNATEVGELNDNCLLTYGITTTDEVETDFTSDRTVSVSYDNEFFGFSTGLGYSNSVERSNDSAVSNTVSFAKAFGPDNFGEVPNGIPVGAQAWGIFLVPDVSNEQYQLYAPDKQQYLGVDVYYTYLKAPKSNALRAKSFDMTDPTNDQLTAATRDFWRGIEAPGGGTFPKSIDYWLWASDATTIDTEENPDYKLIVDEVPVSVDFSGDRWDLTQTVTKTDVQQSTNTLNISAGAFGFSADVSGSITIAASSSTSVGTNVHLDYGINGWTLDQLPKNDDGTIDYSVLDTYLTAIDFGMYWLQAKSPDAFFVPDGAKIGTAMPWCITWHVEGYTPASQSRVALASAVRTDVEATEQLPKGIRQSLLSKLEAARAAWDRDNPKAALNILRAFRNQVEAQSGKVIPAERAEPWITLVDLILDLGSQAEK